ncbi:MAG: 50S ribosomal protein L19e [archaeon GB-1845-036]|nr:50S ribosomal protein L19e [Candidatus Culexmicrobium thermophilum]HDO20151.1 50S ribosomal protein L19e [Candidatus Bathyarchaeota archaeon]
MPATLRTVRRLAAEILKVGESRIWIDPENLDRALEAMTREDVKGLIREGIVKKKPPNNISRGRIRKRKKRRRGAGSIKGGVSKRKFLWMVKVRSQRKFLKMLRRRRIIDRKVYRKLYGMVKGGAFHSISHIKSYIRERELARRR